jgi:pyroglutamyl-peptidase
MIATGATPMPTTLPCVLLTGFEAFGPSRAVAQSLNPSWLAVKALHGAIIAGARIEAAQLPCTFAGSATQLHDLLTRHRPVVVIGVGQAGGRTGISLERIAINLNDAPIPDNEGAQPIDQPVVAGGPAAYFSTLPVKAMRSRLQAAGIAAEMSQTAGTYVCNHAFYALMHAVTELEKTASMTQAGQRRTHAGFVHVPWLPEQGSPSMPLATVVTAIGLIVETALRTEDDVVAAAGALD